MLFHSWGPAVAEHTYQNVI